MLKVSLPPLHFRAPAKLFSHTRCPSLLLPSLPSALHLEDSWHHLVIPGRRSGRVNAPPRYGLENFPCQWMYGSLEVFVFSVFYFSLSGVELSQPRTCGPTLLPPPPPPALLNIDKQSGKRPQKKRKRDNKHQNFGGREFFHSKPDKQTMFGVIAFNKCSAHILEC